MRSVILVAMLVPLLFLTGCAKKSAKNAAPPKDETAGVTPQPQPQLPAPNDKEKNKKEDGPNWLNDPRWKKEQPMDQKPPADEPQGDPLKKGWGIAPPKGGWAEPVAGVQPVQPPGVPPGPGGEGPGAPRAQPTPVVPMPGLPNAPGMGVLQPQPGNPPALVPGAGTPVGAAKKAVAMADMRDLQIFIHDASLVSGKMPTAVEIYGALVKAGSPTAKHVESGAIILTGATERESIWAYEARARLQGGLAVSQNGVETLTADELNKRLGR